MSTVGLVHAGFRVEGACDIDATAVKSFNSQRMLPDVAQVCSVDDYDIPECDLLAGGPVCKAFSPGATLFGTGGKADERNTFPLMLRAIARRKPNYALMENSYGLQRFKGYLAELKDTLFQLGYWITAREINCYDFGVPQYRKRLIFLCTRKGKPHWDWPVTPTRFVGQPKTVGDCMKPKPPSHDQDWPLLWPMSEKGLAYFLRDPRHAKKHPPLQMNKAARTVVAVYRKGVPYGVVEYRKKLYLCGPRLAARLQGVPDHFKLYDMKKTAALNAIGNGFPPPVVAQLAGHLRYLVTGEKYTCDTCPSTECWVRGDPYNTNGDCLYK